MSILVTGAAGFIGSHVCRKLLSENETVIGIDNLDPYYDVRKKEDNLASLKSPFFHFHRVSFLDYPSMKKIMEETRPETIIHLGAKAGVRPSIQQPLAYEETNIQGTTNMLELAHEFEVKNLYLPLLHPYTERMKRFPSVKRTKLTTHFPRMP